MSIQDDSTIESVYTLDSNKRNTNLSFDHGDSDKADIYDNISNTNTNTTIPDMYSLDTMNDILPNFSNYIDSANNFVEYAHFHCKLHVDHVNYHCRSKEDYLQKSMKLSKISIKIGETLKDNVALCFFRWIHKKPNHSVFSEHEDISSFTNSNIETTIDTTYVIVIISRTDMIKNLGICSVGYVVESKNKLYVNVANSVRTQTIKNKNKSREVSNDTAIDTSVMLDTISRLKKFVKYHKEWLITDVTGSTLNSPNGVRNTDNNNANTYSTDNNSINSNIDNNMSPSNSIISSQFSPIPSNVPTTIHEEQLSIASLTSCVGLTIENANKPDIVSSYVNIYPTMNYYNDMMENESMESFPTHSNHTNMHTTVTNGKNNANSVDVMITIHIYVYKMEHIVMFWKEHGGIERVPPTFFAPRLTNSIYKYL